MDEILYGTCSGLIPSLWKPKDNSFYCLHLFIEALASCGIQVVYFPLLEHRQRHKKSRKLKIRLHDEAGGAEAVAGRTNLAHEQSLQEVQKIDFEWPFDPLVAGGKPQRTEGGSQDSPAVGQAGHGAGQPSDGNGSRQDDRHETFATEATYSVFADMLRAALSPLFKVTVGDTDGTTASTDFETILVRGGDLRSLPRSARIRLERRLLFLYAITLFRHSRHPAALWVGGNFSVPIPV